MDAIERALADLTDWVSFERLCCRVLNSEGFKIDPRGGRKDGGRDAIEGDEVTFQFSLQEDVLRKLSDELRRYEGRGKRPQEYVFVSNQDISSETKDKYFALFGELGIKLHSFDRSWLSAKIGSPNLKDLRDELLAVNIITAPDTVRFALAGPMRNAMLGALDEGTKGSLTDERLSNTRALMKAGLADEAERLLREVLEESRLPSGQRFEAHLHRGNIALGKGNVDEAKREWHGAIDTGHPNGIAAANLSIVILILENRPEEARVVIDRALETDPRCAPLINALGLHEWGHGNATRARECFSEAYAIEARPEYLLNSWNLGAEAGRPPSDEDIEEALEKWPTNKELLLIRANRMVDLFQQGHDPAALQKASETISRALAQFMPRLEKETSRAAFSPLDWEWLGCALNTLAGTVYWAGDRGRAEELVRLAMVFDDAPLLSFTLAQLLVSLARYPEAVAFYEAATKRGFDRADLWLQLGNAHYFLYRQTSDPERLERAAYCYDRASKTLPSALNNLAQLYWEVGERDKARDVAAAALNACPDEPVIQCNALLYSCDGDPKTVLAGMVRIEAQHPTNATVLTVLGDTYYQLNEWDKAYPYFARALEAAGPNAGLLEQVYQRAADALVKSKPDGDGRLKALELLAKGMQRLPGNGALAAKIGELSKKQD